jgi:hypothetical protein
VALDSSFWDEAHPCFIGRPGRTVNATSELGIPWCKRIEFANDVLAWTSFSDTKSIFAFFSELRRPAERHIKETDIESLKTEKSCLRPTSGRAAVDVGRFVICKAVKSSSPSENRRDQTETHTFGLPILLEIGQFQGSPSVATDDFW